MKAGKIATMVVLGLGAFLVVLLSFIESPMILPAPDASASAELAPGPDGSTPDPAQASGDPLDPEASPEASGAAAFPVTRCPTGAFADAIEAQSSPRPNRGDAAFRGAVGDPCSYISVYVAAPDPADPDGAFLIDGLERDPGVEAPAGRRELYAVPVERLDGEDIGSIGSVPARRITFRDGTWDGGYRLGVPPGYVWALYLRATDEDAGPRNLVASDEQGCALLPVRLLIREDEKTRLIVKIDLRKRSIACDLRDELPLDENQALVTVITEEYVSEKTIPSLGPLPLLNPVAVALLAGVGRVADPERVGALRAEESARRAATNPISIGLFVFTSAATIILAGFALWVLLRSNRDDSPRRKRRGDRGGPKLTRGRGRRGSKA